MRVMDSWAVCIATCLVRKLHNFGGDYCELVRIRDELVMVQHLKGHLSFVVKLDLLIEP